MADDKTEGPGYALGADHRAPLSDFDPDATAMEVLEPTDYVLNEPTALTDFREKVNDLQFQIEVLKARAASIGAGSVRLGKAGASWADASAHAQLGAYPWAKLAAAFAGTFLVTRLVRALPLGGILTLAVPLVLRQVQPPARRRR